MGKEEGRADRVTVKSQKWHQEEKEVGVVANGEEEEGEDGWGWWRMAGRKKRRKRI